MTWWKALGKEPLAHFVVVGAALFAVDLWRGGGAEPHAPPAAAPTTPATTATTATTATAATAAPGAAAERRIVVDAEVRAELTDALARRHGRPPTPEELAAALEHWIDEEVLFREATLRGLDRDDPIVHQRVAAKMGFVVEQSVVVPEPTDAELDAWFAAHRERWAAPERVDFTHVFVDGSDAAAAARADSLLAQLEAGAAPEALGDRFSGGHRYRGRKLADLPQIFGPEFVVGLDQEPPGRWSLHRSRFGLHLVRVDRREGGKDADFATARPDVRKDWLEQRRAQAVREAVRRLRASWEIVGS